MDKMGLVAGIRYEHRLQWPWPKYVARGETSIPTHDGYHNWSIVWTKEMITEFLPKLNPIGMTYSQNVEWSLDVLESFSEFVVVR